MYRYESGKQISVQELTRALSRLGDLLQERRKHLELVCCGGIISLMYFRSRAMTQDVDAIFPAHPENRKILKELIQQVGNEMGLEADPDSLWFNDSVSFFGLETKSNVIIFQHGGLTLKAAKWEELLAHKVHAFRNQKDIEDAIRLLKEIKNTDKERVYAQVRKHAPFVPTVPEAQWRKQFDDVWQRAYGKA